MNKLFLIFALCLTYSTGLVYSQAEYYTNPEFEENKEKKEKKEKKKLNENIFIGGNIGLSIGRNAYVELAPVVGYRITPRFRAGLGFTYIYHKYELYNPNDSSTIAIKSSYWGPKIIAQFDVLKNVNEIINIGIGDVLLHAEFEGLKVKGSEPYYGTVRDYEAWITNTLLGVGIFQPLGGRGGIALLVLWNVTPNGYSPYSNPIFRMGFYF